MHSSPSGGETTDGPAKETNIFRLKVQMVQSKEHHSLDCILLLLREGHTLEKQEKIERKIYIFLNTFQ